MNIKQKRQYMIKSKFDILFASILLIVLSPIFIVISLLIKSESRGPIIFKQRRIGSCGKAFTIYKFRTMCNNAQNMGSGIFITAKDNRITRVGKVLRKTSLDEIPQLFNVLKGEMSFVGPRPTLENHPRKYEEYNDIDKLRFEVLPGITGYAQAYGRNSISWEKRIRMDVYYFYNFNLLFDMKIIFATFYSVIFSKGTYSNRSNKDKEKNN